MQNLAVLFFFWLSGFVIAHTLAEKRGQPGYGLRRYLVDRFARIYSGWVPALFVVALIDYIQLTYGPANPQNYDYQAYFNVKVFLGNLAMLQYWPGPGFSAPAFGSGGQFWTISIEFFIYIFVGSLFFLVERRSIVIAIILMILTYPVIGRYFAGSLSENVGTGLVSLWFLGFASYHLARNGVFSRFPTWGLIAFSLLLLSVFLVKCVPGFEFDMSLYPVVSFGLLLMTVAFSRVRMIASQPGAIRLIDHLAGYSYSLYLLHLTVLWAVHSFWTGGPHLGLLFGVGLANLLAFGMASVTETRHRALADWLNARISWLNGRLSGVWLRLAG
jgi:peptidoglycan/LPS O-acetylase OafA/YrhL